MAPEPVLTRITQDSLVDPMTDKLYRTSRHLRRPAPQMMRLCTQRFKRLVLCAAHGQGWMDDIMKDGCGRPVDTMWRRTDERSSLQ